MTAVDNITGLRQRREAMVMQHVEAENRHDIKATIATFHHPRYEVNGVPSDGEAAVEELLQGLLHAMPDLHAETIRLRHMDDGVCIEGLITGTHDGDWAGSHPVVIDSPLRWSASSISKAIDCCARRSSSIWPRC